MKEKRHVVHSWPVSGLYAQCDCFIHTSNRGDNIESFFGFICVWSFKRVMPKTTSFWNPIRLHEGILHFILWKSETPCAITILPWLKRLKCILCILKLVSGLIWETRESRVVSTLCYVWGATPVHAPYLCQRICWAVPLSSSLSRAPAAAAGV